MNNAERVVIHYKSLAIKDVKIKPPYGNMGATIIDAILQAGVSYHNVVLPRVERYLKEYYDTVKTDDFSVLIHKEGLGNIIGWRGEKLIRIENVVELFSRNDVQTESCLKEWLKTKPNQDILDSIKGIGGKDSRLFSLFSWCRRCCCN